MVLVFVIIVIVYRLCYNILFAVQDLLLSNLAQDIVSGVRKESTQYAGIIIRVIHVTVEVLRGNITVVVILVLGAGGLITNGLCYLVKVDCRCCAFIDTSKYYDTI